MAKATAKGVAKKPTAKHVEQAPPAVTSTTAAPVHRAKAEPAPVTTAPEPAKLTELPVAAQPATALKKETRIMATTTTEYTEKLQTVIKDASEKAKAAFEKSQAQLGEVAEFTKGNVEALVESGKILSTGLQELSKDYLTGSKSAFETLTAEFKELAAVKTPSDLLAKQSTLLRKHFDAAVAASSKNSEALLKLTTEAFQPISTRVSLAVEKVKQAA